MVNVQVEVTSESEVREAVESEVNAITFDNCSITQIRDYLSLIPSSITTEASGGVNLTNIHEYSGCGVDYISLGSLTHSVKVLDLSLLVVDEK
jgi:nicotinate-nucleotide pyrophosphorylase